MSGLPKLGNGIDRRPFWEKGKFIKLKDNLEKIQKVHDQYKEIDNNITRFRSGQVGPEIEQIIKKVGPRRLQKLIDSGKLKLNVNVKKPFIGFTYNF